MLGRAYYALHLAIRRQISTANGWDIDIKADHGLLIAELYRVGQRDRDAKLLALAKQLEALFKVRKLADYTLSPNGSDAARMVDPANADDEARGVGKAIAQLTQIDFSKIERERLLSRSY